MCITGGTQRAQPVNLWSFISFGPVFCVALYNGIERVYNIAFLITI